MKKQLLLIAACATIGSLSVASETSTPQENNENSVATESPFFHPIKFLKSTEKYKDLIQFYDKKVEAYRFKKNTDKKADETSTTQIDANNAVVKTEADETSTTQTDEETPSQEETSTTIDANNAVVKTKEESNDNEKSNDNPNTTVSKDTQEKSGIWNTIKNYRLITGSAAVVATLLIVKWGAVAKGYHYLNSKKRWSSFESDVTIKSLKEKSEEDTKNELVAQVTKRLGNAQDALKTFIKEARDEVRAIKYYCRQYQWLRSYYLLPEIQCFEDAPRRAELLQHMLLLADRV